MRYPGIGGGDRIHGGGGGRRVYWGATLEEIKSVTFWVILRGTKLLYKIPPPPASKEKEKKAGLQEGLSKPVSIVICQIRICFMLIARLQ